MELSGSDAQNYLERRSRWAPVELRQAPQIPPAVRAPARAAETSLWMNTVSGRQPPLRRTTIQTSSVRSRLRILASHSLFLTLFFIFKKWKGCFRHEHSVRWVHTVQKWRKATRFMIYSGADETAASFIKEAMTRRIPLEIYDWSNTRIAGNSASGQI